MDRAYEDNKTRALERVHINYSVKNHRRRNNRRIYNVEFIGVFGDKKQQKITPAEKQMIKLN